MGGPRGDEPFSFSSGWSKFGGKWSTRGDIEAFDHKRQTIYRSPWEPSFACWPVVWKDRNGPIKVSFVETKGDPTIPPTYRFASPVLGKQLLDCCCKTLSSEDEGRTWKDTGWRETLDSLDGNSDHHWRAVVVNADGTLIRSMPRCIPGVTDEAGAMHVYAAGLAERPFPFERRVPSRTAPKHATFWKSLDRGKTWREISIQREQFEGFWPTDLIRLKDGALITIGMIHGARDDDPEGKNPRLAVSESHDEAKSWTRPQPLEMLPDLFGDIAWCEENSLVELLNGKVLVVCRNAVSGDRRLALTARARSGWTVEEQWVSELPTGGYPHTRMASDGTIFYSGHKHGVYSSADQGRSWTRQADEMMYYPQVIEAGPRRIVTVGHSVGFEGMGDTWFPPPQEMELLASSFSYRPVEILSQTEGSAGPCLAVLEDSRTAEFHARVRMRLVERAGIAFRIQDDPGLGYYVMIVRLGDGPGRWKEPIRKAAVAILEVAKICGPAATTVSKRNAGTCVSGDWVELQVRMSGDHITGAVRFPGAAQPQYIGCRDRSLASGRVGLFTHLSPADFKGFCLLDGSRMIRDSWSSQCVKGVS